MSFFNLNETLNALFNATPIGKIDMYAGSTAPSGWLICDGRGLDSDDYPGLFNVIGTTYGSGDGSTTDFNIPDLRDRFPIGAGSTYNRNDKGGSPYIQAHTHEFTNPSASGGDHSHSFYYGGMAQGKRNALTVYNPGEGSGAAGWSGSHSHTITGGAVGAVNGLPSGQTTGDQGNMPPYIGLNFIIYAGV